MIRRLQSVISLITCSCFVCMASPVSSSIGMVMTTGKVLVDGSEVPGSSVIFSGSRISSGDRSSNIQFSDGTSAVMKPGAVMTVYRDRSVLEQGVAMQDGAGKHSVLADDLTISSADANASVLIGVRDASHVEVAAQQGESEVRTPAGDLVARIKPGQVLTFTLQAVGQTQETSARVCGDLDQSYQLTDMLTQVTYKLQGSGLDQYVGKSIRVTGTVQGAPSGATSQILVVSSVKRLNHPCVNGAGQPSTAGIRKGGIVFLVFVAMGATLLGLGASGGLGTSPSAVTPTVP